MTYHAKKKKANYVRVARCCWECDEDVRLNCEGNCSKRDDIDLTRPEAVVVVSVWQFRSWMAEQERKAKALKGVCA